MISSQNTITSSAANGSTTTFAYDFYLRQQSDLIVTLLNADGSVAPAIAYTGGATGDNSGGSIVFATAPANGLTVVIHRNTYKDQDKDYVANDDFPSDSHENALDQSIILHQEMSRGLKSTLRVPAYETDELPAFLKAERLNKLVGFGATGAPLLYGQTSVIYTEGEILSVPNVAQLDALDITASGTTLVDGSTVRVLSYYAGGDGGGNIFELITSSAAATPLLRAVSGQSGRRWRALVASGQSLPLTAFGVKTDGTDSLTATQLAIDTYKILHLGPDLTVTLGGSLKWRDSVKMDLRGGKLKFTNVTDSAGMGRALIWMMGHFGNSDTTIADMPSFQRTKRLTQTAYPDSNRAKLNDQIAGLHYVVCATVSDAGDFEVGDVVRISCGKDRYDADDTLFRYDRCNRVVAVDSGTGKIWLQHSLNKPISGDGFESSGGGKYNAVEMASGISITAGDYVYDVGGTSKIWKALTTATTNAATVALDTGVSWNSLPTTNDLGVRWSDGVGATASLDGTPVITRVNFPMSDIELKNGKIEVSPSVTNTSFLGAVRQKNTLNAKITDIEINGALKLTSDVDYTEGCNNFLSERVYAFGTGLTVSSGPTDYFHSCYSSSGRIVACSRNGGSGGGSNGVVALAESYSEIHYIDCTIQRDTPTQASTGVSLHAGSEVWLRGNKIINAGKPYESPQNYIDDDGNPDLFTTGFIREMSGNFFRCHSKEAFRGGLTDTRSDSYGMYLGNAFEFFDIAGSMFIPKDIIRAKRVFVPNTNSDWNGRYYTLLPDNFERDYNAPNVSGRKLWWLEANGFWDTNGDAGSGIITVAPVEYNGSGYVKAFAASSTSTNNLILSSTTERRKSRTGAGNGVRYFDFSKTLAKYPALSMFMSGSGLTTGTFGIDISANTFIVTAHGMSTGDLISFTSSAVLPAEVDASVLYSLINTSTNRFQIEHVRGGGAITLSTGGSGTRTWLLFPGLLYVEAVFLMD